MMPKVVKLFAVDPPSSADATTIELARLAGPYKRGQVVWGLWRTFTGPAVTRAPRAIPKTFARRCAKFVELGVAVDTSQRPGRAGTDLQFSLDDAAELGLALDLADIGLNQLEIARWIQRNRATIRGAFEVIVPGRPTYLVIKSRMMLPAGLHRGDPFGVEGANIGEPVVVEGDGALVDVLTPRREGTVGLGGLDRKRSVIEIGDLLESLSVSLPLALVTRRGRR